jgi:acyl-CoA thioesterase II
MSDARTPTNFIELMTLDRVAADFFVGHTPAYPWGRVYGGQVVAQALRAAAATVEEAHTVHSLHAYFVLGGQPSQPILYEVDRLREGRSFTTRRVVARQHGGAILNLDASFQRTEADVDKQESPISDSAPHPDSLPLQEWSLLGDVKEVPPTPGVARSRIWMRIPVDLGDDPVLHACGMAYLSDHNPMDSIVMSHPTGQSWDTLMTASLDHNIWFHRFRRADQWMLFDVSGHGLVNARGMSIGAVHSIDGTHVATVAQEGLVRSPRTSSGG